MGGRPASGWLRLAAPAVFAATLLIRFLIGRQCPDSLAPIEKLVLSDLAIPGLMAKHFLERGEFPYFFWGQNWYGGLDALMHAATFSVLGVSPWSLRVTLLVLYALFCLLVYLVARDLAGERAGLVALLWCALPPLFLAESSLIPSASPLEACVLGMLLVWLAIRLVTCRGAAARRWLYFAAGCCGGLGWWATPLMVYFIAGVGAFVLVRERWRGLRLGLALTLPGFLLGAWPFVVYYVRDPNSTFLGMGQGFHWLRLPFGLRRLFGELLPILFDADRYALLVPGSQWLVAGFYCYAALAFLLGLRRPGTGPRAAARPVILWVFVSFAAIYASSAHAQRLFYHYGVAVLALAPVVVGYAVAEFGGSLRRVAAPVFAALLLGQGVLIWQETVRDVRGCPDRSSDMRMIIDRLERAGLTRVYADYFQGSLAMAFLSQERVIFATSMEERYRPYELLLDEARNPAFLLDDPNAFTPVLAQIGGTAQRLAVGKHSVFHAFEEPRRRYIQIDPGEVRAGASDAADEAWKTLDRSMDSVWSSGRFRSANMWLQFDLGRSRDLGMVRLWNRGQDNGGYALDVSVEVSEDGANWTTVLPRTAGSFYYWSGPRIYFWEWGYRMELRFGPVRARYIRIRQHEDSDAFPWLVDEAYLYEDAGARQDDATAEGRLIQRILELPLTRLYADRWITAKVREAGTTRVETVDLFSVGVPMFFNRFKDRVVRWDGATGFVLDEPDAAAFEKALAAEGVRLTKEAFGRWTLFSFAGRGPRELELEGDPGWWWNGLGVVGTNDAGRIAHLEALASTRRAQGQRDEAATLLARARAIRERRR